MPELAQNPVLLVAFGVFVGVFSGVMGLGGGAVMIPILVLALGMAQARAHAVSLAVMIPPVTLPAVIGYFRSGTMTRQDLFIALLISCGVASGTFFGAKIATSLPKDTLKLVFGFVLVYVAGYTIFSWFGPQYVLRSVLLAGVLAAVAVLMFAATQWSQ